MKIFIDAESTGINPHTAEIIEMYFLKENGDDYLLQSKPTKWSKEAEEVHKIKKSTADKYLPFKDAFRQLLGWLPKEFEFVCYANQNTNSGHITYDYGLFYSSIHLLFCHELDRQDLWWWFRKEYKITPYSVHSLVREAVSCRALTVPLAIKKGNKRKSQDLSQENVARVLGYEYKSHDAIQDVLAMRFIYNELKHLV